MGGHLADIVLLDAAYGHKGQINVGHDPVEIFKAYGVNNVFLGLGGKNRPHAYIVGSSSRARLFGTMGGKANNDVGPHKPANFLHRQVVLPNMHAIMAMSM